MPRTKTLGMVETRNDLSADTRAAVVDLLNQHLADLSDLFTQTKYAHWNVKGRQFYALHLLFDALAEKVEDAVDEVAERITALGGLARGTARMAAENSRLEEFPPDTIGAEDVMRVMADHYAAAAEHVRRGIDQCDELDDKGSSDLLTGIVRELDQGLYFIESHLQK